MSEVRAVRVRAKFASFEEVSIVNLKAAIFGKSRSKLFQIIHDEALTDLAASLREINHYIQPENLCSQKEKINSKSYIK